MADDTYTVARSQTIDAPPARVYAEIADFRRWTAWSPWEGLDPQLKRNYSGAVAGRGAAYAWSGNRRAGQGRMEIVEATEPSKVLIDLLFEKPFKARSGIDFTIEPAPSGSRVVWTLTGRRTMTTKIMGIFKSMDAMMGPDFERGLTRLKAAAETPPAG